MHPARDDARLLLSGVEYGRNAPASRLAERPPHIPLAGLGTVSSNRVMTVSASAPSDSA